MSSNPPSDARLSLRCLQVSMFIEKKQSKFILKFCHVLSFHALEVSFEKTYYTFAQESDKLLWTRLKEKLLLLWEND